MESCNLGQPGLTRITNSRGGIFLPKKKKKKLKRRYGIKHCNNLIPQSPRTSCLFLAYGPGQYGVARFGQVCVLDQYQVRPGSPTPFNIWNGLDLSDRKLEAQSSLNIFVFGSLLFLQQYLNLRMFYIWISDHFAFFRHSFGFGPIN